MATTFIYNEDVIYTVARIIKLKSGASTAAAAHSCGTLNH